MSLSTLLETAPRGGAATGSTHGPADALLYSGNRHDTVPRALLLDRRLTPLERNAWQVFRLQLDEQGLAFPSYEQLRPFLASLPCGPVASHETVARTLTVLRLTRWLSLVRRRRDRVTGRILGNLYVLHDEPLAPFEAMQLDAEYLNLVSQALGHASKTVQRVGQCALEEVVEDPLLAGQVLPTRIQVLAQRLGLRGWAEDDTVRADPAAPGGYPQASPTHDSEEGPPLPLRNRDAHSSESEPGPKPAPERSVRNPKKGRTVSNSVSTVLRAREDDAHGNLRLPTRFGELKPEQRHGVLAAIQQVPDAMRQSILDEWDTRCRSDHVRNPAGYLFGIIQKALRGEFNALHSAESSPVAATPTATQPAPAPASANLEVARAHLARLRTLLHGPP